MTNFQTRAILWWRYLLLACWAALAHAQPGPPDCPPQVSILWPTPDDRFSSGIFIKVKAGLTDPDGSVSEMQFFANTNLIGIVTNQPFNLVWQVILPGVENGQFDLKTVAVENLGAKTEYAPVRLGYYTGFPPAPVLDITSPRDGTLAASPATFVFSAELLATLWATGPVEFFVDTNSVGLVVQGGTFSPTTPLNSVTVSNLLEGDYKLSVAYRGQNGGYCHCGSTTIHVVKLGVQLPSVAPDGRLQFEVVTSFPGKSTIIQASPNLPDWLPVSTNQPSSNSFTFTEPSPTTNSQRFYR